MQFRLTLDDELLASNSGRDEKAARKEYKRDLRRQFHFQLKRVFEATPFLASGSPDGSQLGGPVVAIGASGFGGFPGQPTQYAHVRLPVYDRHTIIQRYKRQGFNFLPLVSDELKLSCSLDVLMLRRDNQTSRRDVDNHLKTLCDALTLPDANQDYHLIAPKEDEDPFYCLLSDDKLISKVAVETDQLLSDIPGKPPSPHDVRLVITVRIQPYQFMLDNLMFT